MKAMLTKDKLEAGKTYTMINNAFGYPVRYLCEVREDGGTLVAKVSGFGDDFVTDILLTSIGDRCRFIEFN